MTLALVVLAAGEGRRLGTDKALVRLRDEEPSTPLGMLLAAGAGLGPPPLVVTGRHHEAIARAFPPGSHGGIELARNAAWAEGRTGGVQLARERRRGCDLCVAPVDVPLVPRPVFRALAEAWEDAGSPARGWLAPCHVDDGERRHGHPIVVGRALADELASWPAHRPLRELRDAAAPLWDVAVAWAEILDDLDEPADLERLRRRLTRP